MVEPESDSKDESFIDDQFNSCCDIEEWEDTEEYLDELLSEEEYSSDNTSSQESIDEFSIRMYFKGVSFSYDRDLISKASGIGVIIETYEGYSIVQVQKKLDFYVQDLVVDHLALLDGLIEAQKNGVKKIIAFTDSLGVYHQIAEAEPHEDKLLVALGYRILELANSFDAFSLKLVCKYELKRTLKLAQEAIGILDEANMNIIVHCPSPNCSALVNTSQHSSIMSNMSSHSDVYRVECQDCHKLVCIRCLVPWHSSMSCTEYQSLLLHNNNCRQCEKCGRMIELTQGCFHVTCWCGHEFCYSCGLEYQQGAQSCQCTSYLNRQNDNDAPESSSTSGNESNQWSWEPSNFLPTATESYSKLERSQLALIQSFLFNDDQHGLNPCQSPPQCKDSHAEAIRNLNQLPWLERFVSVISDDGYTEDSIR